MAEVTDGTRRALGAAAAVLAVAAVGACAVDGDPVDSMAHRSVAASAFPVEPGAEVTTIPPAQLSAIVGDISGLPVGAQIDPPDCAPQPISPLATDTAVQTAFGRAPAPGAPPPAYTTVITRTGDRLDDLAATVTRCRHYTRHSAVPVAIDQRVLDDVPAVSGARVFGYVRLESSPGVATTLLVAQRGNIRVYATRRIAGDADADAVDPALVRLFTAAAAEGLR
ncbi:hypothetical protein [Gordonia crocea]|uniref:hypothetical protein n=1 Tax=Gordonia crocea TaxID=589162 RepID=UPI00137A663C|nr:hypothetical protein [Gordonia crocea]